MIWIYITGILVVIILYCLGLYDEYKQTGKLEGFELKDILFALILLLLSWAGVFIIAICIYLDENNKDK